MLLEDVAGVYPEPAAAVLGMVLGVIPGTWLSKFILMPLFPKSCVWRASQL